MDTFYFFFPFNCGTFLRENFLAYDFCSFKYCKRVNMICHRGTADWSCSQQKRCFEREVVPTLQTLMGGKEAALWTWDVPLGFGGLLEATPSFALKQTNKINITWNNPFTAMWFLFLLVLLPRPLSVISSALKPNSSSTHFAALLL